MPDPAHGYASSPCMLHEFDAEDGELGLSILYLLVQERPEGFHWRVRLHGELEPISISTGSYHSESAARSAGQAALNKACSQFRAFTRLA